MERFVHAEPRLEPFAKECRMGRPCQISPYTRLIVHQVKVSTIYNRVDCGLFWKEQRAGAVQHCLFQDLEKLRWKTARQRVVR
jgi:hypothetical protein